jgi:hypothetical protein
MKREDFLRLTPGSIFHHFATDPSGQELHEAALHHQPDGSRNVEQGSNTNLSKII